MSRSTTPIISFQEVLLGKLVEALKQEYTNIVNKHKKLIDEEFDRCLSAKLAQMSIYLSEKVRITDSGSTLQIEIIKHDTK